MMALTMHSIIKKHAGDAGMSLADIVEAVRTELPHARVTRAHVARELAVLRERHGVEAVPRRPRDDGLAVW